MSCPRRDEILDAINGVADAAPVEGHLESCPACRELYDGMMAATEVLSRTPFGERRGPCLDEAALIAYARRQLLPEREREIEEHLAGCSACLDEIASLADALDAQPGEVSTDLRRRVLRGVPHTESGLQRAITGRASRRAIHSSRFRRQRPSVFVWVAAAAAVLLVVILLASLPGEPPPREVVKDKPMPAVKDPVEVVPPKPEPPKPEPPRPEPPKETPKEEPKRAIAEVPKPEPPKPLPPPPKPEEKPVVRETPKPEPPRPLPPPPKPEEKPVVKETKVETVKYKGIVLGNVYGPLSRKSGAALEKAARGTEVRRGDELLTSARQPASFAAPGYTVFLDRGASMLLEEQEEGETRAVLLGGTALFTVDKRERPFVVGTPHAEAIVVGTSFQVVMEERHTILYVLEGTIRFKNEKGEVLVKAHQRSFARIGERPAAPARYVAETETAWAKRPDLTGSTAKEPWIEEIPGLAKKYTGLVLKAPYGDWETDSGKMVRLTAELVDAGVVIGHHHRDRIDKKIWINIDRGTEGEVMPNGQLGLAVATDRAKKVTLEYLGHLRSAAGVGPDRPIPLVVNFRTHSEVQSGAALEICEVAWTGFNQRTIEQLKALYAQLLEKHKPSYRVEMRFEKIDDKYEFRGVQRNFKFTESDAELDAKYGYMHPQNAQHAIAFFFNTNFGARPEDFEIYPKIMAEMIEFLWNSRRR